MTDSSPRSRLYAPFARRAFFWLWLGMLVSTMGVWAQMVGAQWLFIADPNAATIISLVATANALPAMLFGLPAGVLSDAFDRRWLLVGIQAYTFLIAVLLAVLTALDMMPATLLLAFIFAAGLGLAAQLPTWQPLITELVPRSQLVSATRLDMLNVNVARAIGPAIAGVIITFWGVAQVFVFSAACTVLLLGALLLWRRPVADAGPRERFMPALRSGARYVRHEPGVRRILIRVAMFVAPASAVWTLLPLIANRQLGLDSTGYGVLFAILGVGAVIGSLTLGRLRARFSSNAILAIVAVGFAAAFGLIMMVPGLPAALPLMLVAGFGWNVTIATLNAELQLFLPSWVRARALAVYLMVFTGTQAVASPAWGLVTQHLSLAVAVLTAAVLVAVGGLIGLRYRIPESENADREPVNYWGETVTGLAAEPDSGPIQVMVRFRIRPQDEAAWLEAMDGLRRSRLRTGAYRWELYRIGEDPGSFVEIFTVASWAEHRRQHETRLTLDDQLIEERALAFSVEPATAVHLLPPEPPSLTED